MVFDRLGDLEDYSFRNGFFYRAETRIPASLRDPVLARAITAVDPNFTQAAGRTTVARALVTAASQESGAALGERLLQAAAPSLRSITYSLSAGGRRESVPARKDKPNSWAEVKPGHLWASAKQYLPKLKDKRQTFYKRGSWEELVKRIANWLPAIGEATDPWGGVVRIDNPQTKGDFGDRVRRG